MKLYFICITLCLHFSPGGARLYDQLESFYLTILFKNILSVCPFVRSFLNNTLPTNAMLWIFFSFLFVTYLSFNDRARHYHLKWGQYTLTDPYIISSKGPYIPLFNGPALTFFTWLLELPFLTIFFKFRLDSNINNNNNYNIQGQRNVYWGQCFFKSLAIMILFQCRPLFYAIHLFLFFHMLFPLVLKGFLNT